MRYVCFRCLYISVCQRPVSQFTERLSTFHRIGTFPSQEHPRAFGRPGIWSQRGCRAHALSLHSLRHRFWPAPTSAPPQRHPGGRLLQSHQGRFQQGQQREPDQGGKQRTTKEDQGYRLSAQPEEGSLWEAQTLERLRVSLWDVWDFGHGD